MRRFQIFFTFILLPLDFGAIFGAGYLAYHIRFAGLATDIRPVIFNLPWAEFLQILTGITLVWLVIFALTGLYTANQIRTVKEELGKIILACSLGFVFIVLAIFFVRELFSSRFIVVAGWLLAIILVSTVRLLIRGLKVFAYNQGLGRRQIIIIGASDSQTTNVLIQEFSGKKNLGYDIIKRLNNFELESAKELEDFLKIKTADEIIQSDPNLSKAEVLRLYDFAYEHQLTFRYAADLLDAKVSRIEMEDIAGIPIAEVKQTPLDGWGRIIKRVFDLLAAAILIILVSPIMLAVAIAIKLDSRGTVFFSRLPDDSPLQRVGQGNQAFRYLKFRSMIPDAHDLRQSLADRNLRADGPMMKIHNDPRVTRVGRFIRRFSLDELPELFLVFIGAMSLVGPRPHLPEEVAKYKPHHRKVLTIKPGITGLAQISGRSDLPFEDEIKLDIYYIENWSFFQDLIILLKTPLAVFRHRQAE